MTAGKKAGLLPLHVPGTDSSGVTQEQSGWIVVGNPSGDVDQGWGRAIGRAGNEFESVGNAGAGAVRRQRGGSDGILHDGCGHAFEPDRDDQFVGSCVVVLTLPANAGAVHVTAEGQYALGHPVVTFTETAQ